MSNLASWVRTQMAVRPPTVVRSRWWLGQATRTLLTSAYTLPARHLAVRHDPVRPSRDGHAPPRSPLTTRFTVREAEMTGFDVKRLGWMTGDNEFGSPPGSGQIDVPDFGSHPPP